MVLKFTKTKKQAVRIATKVNRPGVVVNRTSAVWRNRNKRRKDKFYSIRY